MSFLNLNLVFTDSLDDKSKMSSNPVNLYREQERSLADESKEVESEELNYSGGEESDEERKENPDLTDARLNEILPEDDMDEGGQNNQTSDNNLQPPSSQMDDLKLETIDQNDRSDQDENKLGEGDEKEESKGRRKTVS